jgi:hypothetical protein
LIDIVSVRSDSEKDESQQPQPQQSGQPPKTFKHAGDKKTTKLRRPPPNLDDGTNSKALESWRNYEPPSQVMRIPDELVLQDKSHKEIARQHGAFIFSDQVKPSGGYLKFGMCNC